MKDKRLLLSYTLTFSVVIGKKLLEMAESKTIYLVCMELFIYFVYSSHET